MSQGRRPQIIEVTFTESVAAATLTPKTASDPADSASFLVENAQGASLPGTVTLATPTTARFRVAKTWPKGDYRVTLFGDVDPTGKRPTISTPTNPPQRLDGEPTQLPSGNDRQGGNFVFELSIV